MLRHLFNSRRSRRPQRGRNKHPLGFEALEERRMLAGELDPTFGTGGLVIGDFGRTMTLAGAALQADGKVVVATHGFELVRYNIDGSLDTTFDMDGVVTPASLPVRARAEAVAVYQDSASPHFGKIIVAGTSQVDPRTSPATPYPQVTLMRYNGDGTLDDGTAADSTPGAPGDHFGTANDPTAPGGDPARPFSAPGIVTFATHGHSMDLGGQAVGKAVAIDSAGRIVVGVTSLNGSTTFQSVLRFLPNGTPDPSFGVVDGQLNFNFVFFSEEITGLILQSDVTPEQKIVISGTGYRNTFGRAFALARIDPLGGIAGRGALDPSFGSGGIAITDFTIASGTIPQYHDAWGGNVALAPDGDILMAGAVHGVFGPTPHWGFAAARYSFNEPLIRDGTLSQSFGGPNFPGRVVHELPGANVLGRVVAVQSNSGLGTEKFFIGGVVETPPTGDRPGSDFGLLRLNWDGQPDLTFGANGWVVTDFGTPAVGSSDDIDTLLLGAAGDTITAVGNVRLQGGPRSFGLARYLIGNPDFDGDGVLNVVEDGHPNKVPGTAFGDGNGDAVAVRDAEQSHVASLPNAADGAYLTITAQGSFRDARAMASADAPPLLGATRPVGAFSFRVEGGSAGFAADFEFFLPPGTSADSFFQFGATPDDRFPHWTQIPLSPPSNGGDFKITLMDGKLGDGDGLLDGVITVLGAPAILDATPLSITGNLFNDLDGDGLLDLGFPPEPALSNWTIYLDADGDEILDPGEPWSLSDAVGNYAFLDDDTLPGGSFEQDEAGGGLVARVDLERRTYAVAVVLPPGWINTRPGAYRQLNVGAGGRAIINRIVPGDLDLDGDQDLIVLGAQLDVGNRSTFVYRNRGDASFFLDTAMSDLLEDPNADDVVTADFNKDGLPDIVQTVSGSAGSFGYLYFDDPLLGGFRPHAISGMGQDTFLRATSLDLNGDGFLDLVVGTKHYVLDENGDRVHMGGRLGVMLNQWDQWIRHRNDPTQPAVPLFSAPVTFDLPGQVTDLAVGDFTHDGILDVATANIAPGGNEFLSEFRVWQGNGVGALAPLTGLPADFPTDLFVKSLTVQPPLDSVYTGPARLHASGLLDSDTVTDYVVDTPDHNDAAIIPGRSRTHLARLGGNPQWNAQFGNRSFFPGAIVGAVFGDIDGNQRQNFGEPSLGGIRIILDHNHNGTFDLGIDQVATSRHDGVYSFSALPPGDYQLLVELPAGYETTVPAGGAGIVSVTTGLEFLDFGIRSLPGTIRGTVWHDQDADGVRDDEPGLSGVNVLLDMNANGMPDSSEPVTITDTNGAYEFANVPSGRSYDVRILPHTGFAQVYPDPLISSVHRFDLAPAGTAVANFGLARTGTVEGLLFVDRDLDGDFDVGEYRLPNVEVWVDANRNGLLDPGEPRTVTRADGSYTLTNVPPGRQLVATETASTFAEPGTGAFGFSVAALGRQIAVGDPSGRRTGGLPSSVTVLDAFTDIRPFPRKLGLEPRHYELLPLAASALAIQLASLGAIPDAEEFVRLRLPVPDTLGFAVTAIPGAIIGSSLSYGPGRATAWNSTTGTALSLGGVSDYPDPNGYLLAPVQIGTADPDYGFVMANAEGWIDVRYPTDPEDHIGPRQNVGQPIESIAAFGPNQVVLGSPEAVEGAVAYLYDIANGVSLRTYRGRSPQSRTSFGSAVAVAGDDIIIGAPGEEEAPGAAVDSGAVYVFDADDGDTPRYRLANPAPTANDHFGFAVASVGEFVVVGAPHDDARGTDAGAVYVFDRATGRLLRTMYSPAPAAGAYFGFSLAPFGTDQFLVGSPALHTADPGAVHLLSVGAPVIVSSGAATSGANFSVPAVDRDTDGIPDFIEAAAPNGGDGNNDGVADADPANANVASLPSSAGDYVTLVSPAGTALNGVAAIPNPSPFDALVGAQFPLGFFEFSVQGVSSGGATTVELILHEEPVINSYYKYGATPSNHTPHWYDFLFDGTTGAALMNEDADPGIERIILHFVDGQRGDDDLAANGRIVDPGGPALLTLPALAGDDDIHVVRAGDELAVYVNVAPTGEPNYRVPLDRIATLTILGGEGNDVLTVDSGQHPELGLDRLIYNGGSGTNALILARGSARIDSTALGGTLNTSIHAGARLTTSRLIQNALSLAPGSRVTLLPSGETSVITSLSLATGATLDIGDNALVLDYTGDSPLAEIREKTLSGRGGPGFGASWNGTGITSSAAAQANQTDQELRSVAVAENVSLPLGPYATFRGQVVDNTSILIAYTRTADADLNSVVNDDDVTIVGATYAPGVPQPHWGLADFDYNGFIDDDDVTLLGVFYNPSATPVATPGPSSQTVETEASDVVTESIHGLVGRVAQDDQHSSRLWRLDSAAIQQILANEEDAFFSKRKQIGTLILD